jgi:hypothetical protein
MMFLALTYGLALTISPSAQARLKEKPAVPDFEVAQEIARAVCFEKYDQELVLQQFPFEGEKKKGKWLLDGRSLSTEFFGVLGPTFVVEIDAATAKIELLRYKSIFEGDVITQGETAEAIAHAIGCRKFGDSAMRRSFPSSVVLKDGIWEFRQLRDVPDRLNPTDGAVKIQLRAADGSLVLADRKKA